MNNSNSNADNVKKNLPFMPQIPVVKDALCFSSAVQACVGGKHKNRISN